MRSPYDKEIFKLGLPAAMIALAGQGYLRGTSDLPTPVVILIVANLANVVLEVLFVYGFGWGIEGSAWGTVIAQAGMGVAFTLHLLRPSQPPWPHGSGRSRSAPT